MRSAARRYGAGALRRGYEQAILPPAAPAPLPIPQSHPLYKTARFPCPPPLFLPRFHQQFPTRPHCRGSHLLPARSSPIRPAESFRARRPWSYADGDLERSLLASEVLAFSAALAGRAGELVDQARQTAAAAVDHPASGLLTEAADSMARAAMALSVADAYTRPRAAVKSVGCAAKLSMAAREVNSGELAEAAYTLAEEDEEVTRMATDLKANMMGFARQHDRGLLARIAAFCTSRVRPSSVRSFAQGGTSAMQPVALGLSIGLFPYMGRQGILSKDNFSDNELWWINTIFSSWWILVSLDMAASLCPETRLLMEYVRLSSHISMLGITILVILYGYVMLAPDAWIAVLIFLAIACVLHVGFYVQGWPGRVISAVIRSPTYAAKRWPKGLLPTSVVDIPSLGSRR